MSPSEQTSPENIAVAEQPAWLYKNQAAARLGLDPRRILQLAKEKTLRSKLVRANHSRRKVIMVDSGDVQRYLETRKQRVMIDVDPSAPAPGPAPELPQPQKKAWISHADSEIVREFFQVVVDSIKANAIEKPLPVWLTIRQASEYSGLPQGILRKAIADKSLPHWDVGRSAQGGRYRIKRAVLEGM